MIALHLSGLCQRGHSLDEHASRHSDGRVICCKDCRREDYAALPEDELNRRRAVARDRANAWYARKKANA